MIGRVVSTKMKNTVVVLVERTAKHPLYKKTFIRSKKYLVDADASIKDGDVVEIVKIKPISKNKHWKITRVVGKDLIAINEEELKVAAEKAIAQVMPEEKEEPRVESLESSEAEVKIQNSKVKSSSKKSKVVVRKEKTSH